MASSAGPHRPRCAVNPLALALLYPGLGAAPLPPVVLGGHTRLEANVQAGLSPRLSVGVGIWRPAKRVGWDTTLRGGARFARIDPGLWIHGGGAGWGVGARVGGIAAVTRFADPWFGGSVHAQVAKTLGDRAAISATGGVEVITGIYIESGIGPHPYGVGDVRLDWALGENTGVSVGVGWPHLVGIGASTRL